MAGPNAELAYAVLNQIDLHPETWKQDTWDCGTAACFAGWAVRLSGGFSEAAEVVEGPTELVGMTVEDAAYKLLGIEFHGAHADEWLFDADNTREDLGRLVAEIFGPRPDGAACERCKADPPTGPCCSSHDKLLCHACYRDTHHVEVCVVGCPDCAREVLPVVMGQ